MLIQILKDNKESSLIFLRNVASIYANMQPGLPFRQIDNVAWNGLCCVLSHLMEHLKQTSLAADYSAHLTFLNQFKPANTATGYWYPTLLTDCSSTIITQEDIDRCITPRIPILNQIIKHIENEL